jgi:hypothetical protein
VLLATRNSQNSPDKTSPECDAGSESSASLVTGPTPLCNVLLLTGGAIINWADKGTLYG